MNYLGIDISKSTARCVILDNDGEKSVKPFTLKNNKYEFNELLERFKKHDLGSENLLIGIEATGIWWENIYCFLTEQKFKIVVLNPHQTNKFREALRKKAKTDDIDAYVIAGLMRSNEYAQSFVPEETVQILKDFTKLRYRLIKDQKDYQRQALSLLALVFPEYEQTKLKKPFGIAAAAILKKFSTAKHLAEAKPKHIEKIVRSIKGNNFDIKEIIHLIQTAKDSIYSGRAANARALNLNIMIEQVQNMNKSIDELDKQIENILSSKDDNEPFNFPGGNLLSIPGVGQKTIASIISAVGTNAETFKDSKKIIGYVGFYPKIYQSGETLKANKIAKRGPAYLRSALYIAAVACIKHNAEFRALYQKKRSQGKASKQALIYVAKKLAHLSLSMLKSGELYRPERVFMPV